MLSLHVKRLNPALYVMKFIKVRAKPISKVQKLLLFIISFLLFNFSLLLQISSLIYKHHFCTKPHHHHHLINLVIILISLNKTLFFCAFNIVIVFCVHYYYFYFCTYADTFNEIGIFLFCCSIQNCKEIFMR